MYYQINNSKEWNEHVVNSPKPVVVSFFADWQIKFQARCAPCHKLNPQLIEEAQKNTEKWQLALVNVENEELYDVVQKIAVNINITQKAQIPSVYVMNHGTQIDYITGYSERKTKTLLQKVNAG